MSERAKPTPGPWHVTFERGLEVVGADGVNIAELWLRGRVDEHRATANLIAAAPDYDAVAREMAAEHDAGQQISDALWQKLYDVIAKACGESK